MTIRIGISGWRYAPWRGEFYPPGLVQRRELEYAAGCFPTIEINGSFYSLQSPDSYTAWHDATPDDFVFAVKGPRYITHLKRLRDVERPLANFLASGVLRLGGKLGPMLWQLPPTLKFDEALIDAFLSALPRDTDAALSLARRRDVALMRGRSALAIDRNRPLRHALEVRHDSFLDRRFVQLLRRHRTALVVADTAGRWPYLEDVTADFLYLRLHGDAELYVSGYSDDALSRWAGRIRHWSGGGEAPAQRRGLSSALLAHVQHQRVFLDLVAVPGGDLRLQLLDLAALELDDLATVDVDHVVVVVAPIQLVYRLAGFEVVLQHQPGRLELREHPVHRCQPDVLAMLQQRPVDVLGGHVVRLGLLQQLQDAHAWVGDFQAGLAKVVRFH